MLSDLLCLKWSVFLTASPAGCTWMLNPAILTHSYVAKISQVKTVCSVTSIDNMPLYSRLTALGFFFCIWLTVCGFVVVFFFISSSL